MLKESKALGEKIAAFIKYLSENKYNGMDWLLLCMLENLREKN